MTLQEKKQELINKAIGRAASLHFGDSPDAVFESTKAKQIAEDLFTNLEFIEGDEVQALVEALTEIAVGDCPVQLKEVREGYLMNKAREALQKWEARKG